MNFEDIKAKMDSGNMENIQVPEDMKELKSSEMPIEKVRKTMRGEIIVQLVCIVIFFAVPSLIGMHQLPKSIYYILMFVTSLITLGYLAKMIWFLNKTSSLSANSKETVIAFIHDLKLTLEVYKTAVIAGSLLLPFSLTVLVLGINIIDEEIFMKFITLSMPASLIAILVIAYLVLVAIIYYSTVAWANSLYGKHIKTLEKTLREFEV